MIQKIFQMYGPQYLTLYGDRMPQSHKKTIRDIMTCRNGAFGTMVNECKDCRNLHFIQCCCGNRHCPCRDLCTTHPILLAHPNGNLNFMINLYNVSVQNCHYILEIIIYLCHNTRIKINFQEASWLIKKLNSTFPLLTSLS